MSNYGNSGERPHFDLSEGSGPPALSVPPFHHFSRFLVLVGLVILCMVIFTIAGIKLGEMIFGVVVGGEGTIYRASRDAATVNALKLVQAFTSIGTFIVPAILFAKINRIDFIQTTRLNRGFTIPALLLSLSVLLFASPLIGWMIEMNERLDLPVWLNHIEAWMREMENDAALLTGAYMKMPGFGDFLVNMLIVALLPAICEEVLFRGICIPFFREWTGKTHAAIWITAFLFSLIHIQFFGFLPRMMLGVLLGYVFIWSGSLWVPLIVHFINNGLIVVMAYVSNEPGIQGLEDVTENSEWTALGSALVISGLLYLLHRIRYREPAVVINEPANVTL